MNEFPYKFNDDLFDPDWYRSDFIFDKFAPTLCQKASVDPFVRTVGVPDYVNAILIPELAVMLIMKNMRVNNKMPWDILYKSIKFGELINEKTSVMW